MVTTPHCKQTTMAVTVLPLAIPPDLVVINAQHYYTRIMREALPAFAVRRQPACLHVIKRLHGVVQDDAVHRGTVLQ